MPLHDSACFFRFILKSAWEALSDLLLRSRSEYPWRQRLQALESENHESLRGRWAIVTGSNSGIGFETARLLATAGLGVILACRNEERGKAAESALNTLLEQDAQRDHLAGPVEFKNLDVADLVSVQAFVQDVRDRSIAVLVCNAGVLAVPWSLTPQGHEISLGTNHLGHALLAQLLLPTLKKHSPSRIVFVSSRSQEGRQLRPELFRKTTEAPPNFDRFGIYSIVKAAQLCYILKLAEEVGSGEVAIHAVHPGCVNTSITQNFPLRRVMESLKACSDHFLMISLVEAASYVFRACVAADAAPEAGTGLYFHCGQMCPTNGPADNPENCAVAWRLTQEALAS
mmetsp:Transcript_46517/g.108439  ORF Transcript_46517/g.108439 Transcript_46517/m.108439 type:complete len:342 (+) Transcript_46517:31-1056(+)